MAKQEQIRTVKGMSDILPEDLKYWDFIEGTFKDILSSAGFYKIVTPIVESASLFERPIGEKTDIVEKEMYYLERKQTSDKKEKLALRPEGTASVVRAYIQNGMQQETQPVKFFYFGPMFRHDKPQKGRLRQFFHIGAEAIGDDDPMLDAEIISISYRLLKKLGVNDFSIQINSIGTPKTRENFVKKLREYYSSYLDDLCPECKVRIKSNPLRLLDCKEQTCQKYKEGSPQIIDFLESKDKLHFMEVLEYLDELEIPYELNTHLVRGLDYYTRTVFEVWPQADEIKDPSRFAVGGGGRYDGLAEIIGGKPTPGIGFAFGVERIIEVLKMTNKQIIHHNSPDVFVVQLGGLAKKKSLKISENLRSEGFKVVSAPNKDSIKSQLKLADKLKAPIAVIIGQKEVLDGTVILRDMNGGMQETVNINIIEDEIKKR
ncbi:histidine--tRNA ligase [bacterium]|nr:histidine--tRNA ligase [bacterium]